MKVIKNSPVFGLALGLCPVLALSNNFESSLLMGILVTIVSLVVALVTSLLRNVLKKDIKVMALVVIIATIITIIDLLLKAYLINVSNLLGIYLSILVVNCLILGKALTVYTENTVLKSCGEALKTGGGFLFAISLIALFREVLGNNSLTIFNELSQMINFKLIITNILPPNIVLPNAFFNSPAGAFVIIGFIAWLGNKKDIKEAENGTH